MHWRNWIGVPAGAFILIVGAYIFGLGNPCFLTLERTSYIGNIQVAPDPEPPVRGPDATSVENAVQVENPYGMQVCDHWPSAGERVLNLVAVAFLFLITGAVAARIGPTISRWRGFVAPIAGFMLIWMIGVIFGDIPMDLGAWKELPIAISIGGAIGLAGAECMRFWHSRRSRESGDAARN